MYLLLILVFLTSRFCYLCICMRRPAIFGAMCWRTSSDHSYHCFRFPYHCLGLNLWFNMYIYIYIYISLFIYYYNYHNHHFCSLIPLIYRRRRRPATFGRCAGGHLSFVFVMFLCLNNNYYLSLSFSFLVRFSYFHYISMCRRTSLSRRHAQSP